nr:MAG TPA: hypothetical protein [Crassvirales sp.]
MDCLVNFWLITYRISDTVNGLSILKSAYSNESMRDFSNRAFNLSMLRVVSF